jgi:hypothetical protein
MKIQRVLTEVIAAGKIDPRAGHGKGE